MSARTPLRLPLCCALVVVCLASAGCNPFTALYFLFLLPPPKVDAAYAGLEEQKVVVLVYAGRGSQFEYTGIDNDLARGIVRELRENVDEIELADPNDVRRWRDEHSDFELLDVGRHFKANRVVYVEVESYGLYEHQSPGLYRGNAKARVQVADIEKEGEIVWEEFVELQFPGSRPIAESEMSREKFRALFTRYLTRQIAHHFFDYRPDEDFTVN